jgi:Ribonuclease G/E
LDASKGPTSGNMRTYRNDQVEFRRGVPVSEASTARCKGVGRTIEDEDGLKADRAPVRDVEAEQEPVLSIIAAAERVRERRVPQESEAVDAQRDVLRRNAFAGHRRAQGAPLGDPAREAVDSHREVAWQVGRAEASGDRSWFRTGCGSWSWKAVIRVGEMGV